MSFEAKDSVYNILPTNVDLILRYQPRFFDRGGDHLVYKVPDHPEVVVKASWRKIKDILYTCHQLGLKDEASIAHFVHEQFDNDVAQKNREVRALKRHFGNEHVLSERRCLMRVPVSEQILNELFRNDYLGRTLPEEARYMREAWTHVAVQSYCDEVENPNHLTFSFGLFIEENGVEDREYIQVTNQLINHPHDALSPSFLQMQDVSSGKFLTKLIDAAQHDSVLKESLADFLRKTISYAQTEMQILALGGKDNVIFFPRDGGKWDYKLIDALPIPDEPILHRFMDDLAQASRNNMKPTKAQRGNIIRVFNFIRVINGAAAALDVNERIELPHIPEVLIRNVLHD